MNVEFVIPMNHDALLTRSSINQYVVEEVLPLRMLPGALQDFKSAMRNDPFAIISHFDTAFSILCLQKDVDCSIKEDLWDMLIKVGQCVTYENAKALEDSELSSENRLQNLNALKMTCYMICQFIDMFESEDTKPSIQLNVRKGKGKQPKKSTVSVTGNKDWEVEKQRGVQILLNLVQRNLNRLWDPPVAEEEFVNLVSNCCYRLLENPAIAKSKETRDVISHLLAVLVKKYNHTLGAALKIMQLLQHFEHLVAPIVHMLEIFVYQYQNNIIVDELMREIGRMDTRGAVQDTTGTRIISQFLVELAQHLPGVMLPNVVVLLDHLDGESHTLRNGVVGVMGEIIVRYLSEENIEEKLKATRESFFDVLEARIYDVNAFVRSRILQVWLAIVNKKCLPLQRRENLVDHIIGRLRDKSCQVRRHAIQLMIALMTNNPFASKLEVDALQSTYETENEKLKAMMPDEVNPTAVMAELEVMWNNIQVKFRAELKQFLRDRDTEDTSSNEFHIEDEVTVDRMIEMVFGELVEDRYVACYHMIKAANLKWPEELVFQYSGDEGKGDEEKNKDGEEKGNEDEEENRDEEEEMEEGEDEEKKDEEKTVGENSEIDGIVDCLQNIYMVQKQSAIDNFDSGSQSNVTQDNEIMKQQLLVQYLKDCTTFARQIQKGIPLISQLLGSNITSDVFEAIEFFVTGFEFGVTATMIGIRRMLTLVWSKEQPVKDAVVAAYKRLYLQHEGQRAVDVAITKNLIALLYGANLMEVTSFEALFQELVKADEIGQNVVKVLWETFIMKLPNTTNEESRAALLLLSMIGGAKPEIIKCNIDVLVSEGLGPRAESDLLLAQIACKCLLKVGAPEKTKGKQAGEPVRFSEDHEIFSRLSHILVQTVGDMNTRVWVPFAEQAISVIYQLSEKPDKIMGDVIKTLVQEQHQTMHPTTIPTTDSQPDQASGSQDKASKLSTVVLTRLLSLSGHVALRQLVHLDVDVFNELKRRRQIQEDKKESEQQKKPSRKSSISSSVSKSKDDQTESGEGIEEELGLAGAGAEDADAEFIREICENDIVTGETLLSSLRSLMVTVCTNPTKYPDTELQTAATLALSKFCLVSSKFCEVHLQLLFTILEKSPNPDIRANTIIALGDLSVRFPNLIEPWTPHLYGRLRDESALVRKNTLQVLTHLILNDMVKVKGQISELGVCIVDHDERISNLAKLFWLELSKKGNAVYNVLPDVISRLSDPAVGVDEDCFRTVIKHLFSYIQKDRQSESLVEKICQRYRVTREDRQWRDLSFCLSLLSYSEKSLRKLLENLPCYADKMVDDEVYSCFTSIINKSRSFCKPEAKTLIDELEEKFEKCHRKGLEEEEISQKASDTAVKKRNKNKTPAKTQGRRKVKSKKDSDDLESPVVGRRSTRGRKATKVRLSSDEESDEDQDIEDSEFDEIFSPQPTSAKKSKNGRTPLGRRQSMTSE